jgi:hypothetical protein
MPELVTCPSCGCKVQVADCLLGQRTRCIACNHVFVAGTEVPPPEAAAPATYPLWPQGEDEPPMPGSPRLRVKGLTRHDWPLCPRCHRPAPWEALVCPHCSHLFEPESSHNNPWDRRDAEPHRGKLIDVLGSIALLAGTFGVCVGGLGSLVALSTGIPALVMAKHDLDLMSRGEMDLAGRRDTVMGRSKALAGVVFAVVLGILFVLVVANCSP